MSADQITDRPHHILWWRRVLAIPFYILALILDLLGDFFECAGKKIAGDNW